MKSEIALEREWRLEAEDAVLEFKRMSEIDRINVHDKCMYYGVSSE
jgi:hypothetical protein